MTTFAVRKSLAVLAAAVGVAACEGENLFTSPSSSDQDGPVVTAVTVPEGVRPGEVLEVEVSATSEEGVTLVDITLIEDVVRERELVVYPPENVVTAFTEFQLPTTLATDAILVRVEVQDVRGARSDPFEVEVPVLPPQSSF